MKESKKMYINYTVRVDVELYKRMAKIINEKYLTVTSAYGEAIQMYLDKYEKGDGDKTSKSQ